MSDARPLPAGDYAADHLTVRAAGKQTDSGDKTAGQNPAGREGADHLTESAPNAPLPANSVDAHAHITGEEFPPWSGRVEDPPPGRLDECLRKYREQLAVHGCSRGVLVHSILYGSDHAVTRAALQQLGSGFCGVGLAGDDASASDLDRLAGWGFRALRMNRVHGGLLGWQGATRLAPALASRGMHLEMLLHSDLHLEALEDDIRALPTPLVIDHCGWPSQSRVSSCGHRLLCRLLADDQVWVKLSAVWRFAPDRALARKLMADLIMANPRRCLWGSDWPHLMSGGLDRPDTRAELDLLLSVIPDLATRQAVFVDNPGQLYRIQGRSGQ